MGRLGFAGVRVAILWQDTIVAEKLIAPNGTITVGTRLDNTFVLPETSGLGERHTLVQKGLLHLTERMRGRLRHRGGELPVEDVGRETGYRMALEVADRGVLDLGPVALFFECVAALPRSRGALLTGIEPPVPGSLLTAAAAHLVVILLALVFWDPEPSLAEIPQAETAPTWILEPPAPHVEIIPPAAPPAPRVAHAAPAPKGPQGAAGEPDKPTPTKLARRNGPLTERPKLTAVTAISNLAGEGPLATVFSEDPQFGPRLTGAVGASDGEIFIGRGHGGVGIRGTGTGGGGQSVGALGGMGNLPGSGGGKPAAALGARKKTTPPKVASHSLPVAEACRADDIQAVVALRMSGVKHCYEKELAADPELAGRVTFVWRIGLDGRVQKVLVDGDALGNKQALGCMQRTIARWQFPRPDGAQCQVRFSFVFSNGQ